MPQLPDIKKLYFKDTPFVDLMHKRVYNILLIASRYDAFILEDDGRVDEQIFNEYVSLSLRYPPRFVRVSTEERAFQELSTRRYDLIISMLSDDSGDTFELAKRIKKEHPAIPIVVLTPFSREVSLRISDEDLSAIDYVFSWLGNTDLLLAIIKLIEDKMNVEHDVEEVGVQVILFVEDSIRYYSSLLPHIYKFVLQQSQAFSKEALNEHLRTMRMRGRPKILLARNYEEAVAIFDKYKANMLGIISDVSFNREGVKDKQAGIKFLRYVRSVDKFVPCIMESSEVENAQYANELETVFIDKNSKKLPVDLRNAIMDNFGFGDFIFRDPKTGAEVARISALRDLHDQIFNIPDDSLVYHISRNHISRWLYSRAMFPIARFLRAIDFTDDLDLPTVRQIIFDSVVTYRKMKNRGVVATFQKDRFDRYSNFARIGEGSLGGKARGLAFLDSMIKRHPEWNDFSNAQVDIPKTVVLCTDIFDEFMEINNLYTIALSDSDDETILTSFLAAQFPERLHDDLLAFINVVGTPIAVRSSSLLEDAHYQPFAGIYSTYMIPSQDDRKAMLLQLCNAIKGVYASVFYRDSKAYMMATSNVIDQEKMAVVLQEVCGSAHGNRFYPSFSGVARSLNFYPIGNEQTEDGVVNIALGLGKYIVDGGVPLRFSPKYPRNVLQTSTLEMALRETQTQFYALDISRPSFNISVDDGYNILKLPVNDAIDDGTLRYIASTYNPHDQMIVDRVEEGGRKIISFANILQHDVFPLAPLLDSILHVAAAEMGKPVELELAVNLNHEAQCEGILYLLQIRPIVQTKEILKEDIGAIPDGSVILKSYNALGYGIMNTIHDVVYVKTANFDPMNNAALVNEINEINKKYLERGENYVLIGPGRWGSSDPYLGIPVKWAHISGARVIVEASLKNYRIDPSQGTHFFQNLTSFGVGYFTINPSSADGGVYDEAYLNNQPAIYESEHIRQVHFENPITVKIDGKNKGVVLKS